jgi:4-amino-4-deoxy-L-arabinose transferase-like glycosyltransferase
VVATSTVLVWRNRDTALLAGVLMLAAGLRLAFAFRAPLFVVNDSLSYVLPAWELMHGEGFFPLFKRPPLYPLMLAKVLWLFGEDPQAIAAVQHGLGLAIVGLTFVLGFMLAGTAGGTVAGVLSALSGPLILTEHYLMSETLFALLLIAAVVVFILAETHGAVRLAILTGVLLALAALTRPIAQMIVPLFAVWLLWRYRGQRKTAVRLVMGLCVAFAVVVTPWMLRNLLVHGSFTVAGGMGEGIAVRTIRYEQRFDFRSAGTEAEPLRSARRIYRDEAEDGSAFELAARLRDELNVSPAVADGLMRQIALEAIGKQPAYYVIGTAGMFWDILTGRPARLRQDWVPWRGMVWDERIPHLLPRATPLQDLEFATAERVVSIYDPARWWPIVLGLAAIGVVFPPPGAPKRFAALMAFLVLAQILAAAALVGIEWRYRYPLDPLINVLMGMGVVALTAAGRFAAGFSRRWRIERGAPAAVDSGS